MPLAIEDQRKPIEELIKEKGYGPAGITPTEPILEIAHEATVQSGEVDVKK